MTFQVEARPDLVAGAHRMLDIQVALLGRMKTLVQQEFLTPGEVAELVEGVGQLQRFMEGFVIPLADSALLDAARLRVIREQLGLLALQE